MHKLCLHLDTVPADTAKAPSAANSSARSVNSRYSSFEEPSAVNSADASAPKSVGVRGILFELRAMWKRTVQSGSLQDELDFWASSTTGVLNSRQLSRLRWMARFPWDAVQPATVVDKLSAANATAATRSSEQQGASSRSDHKSGRARGMQWTGTVGLRTPIRSAAAVDHRASRHLASFACLRAIEAVLSAA